jgi:hypothetical protein
MHLENNMTAHKQTEGGKETDFEYICSYSNCQNPAVEVVGVVPELGVAIALCRNHAEEKAGRR